MLLGLSRTLIALAALHQLAKRGDIKAEVVKKAVKTLGINPDKLNPSIS